MGLKPRMRPRREPQARDTHDNLADALVQKYLNDCGGEDSGFTWGPDEEALRFAISRELGYAYESGAILEPKT